MVMVAIVKSFNHRRMSFLENQLHIANSSRRDPGKLGNLFTHINVLSFWQICQSLVLTAGDLVGKSLRLEIRLLFKRQLCSGEIVPGGSWPVQGQNQLQRFIGIQFEFDTVDLCLSRAGCGMPFCNPAQDYARPRDQNRLVNLAGLSSDLRVNQPSG
jgi:hypothetical protein